MLRVLSKSECMEHEREVIACCRQDHPLHCDMYNFMKTVKGARRMGEFDERQRILNFLRKQKYLSKKKLDDFIMEPVRQEVANNPYVLSPVKRSDGSIVRRVGPKMKMKVRNAYK